MGGSANARILVAGSGALGATIALTLARSGAEVVLADGSREGDNASGVAAGMLAPVGEAVFDDLATRHLPLLMQARDLWPRFASALGQPVHRCGAVLLHEDAHSVAKALAGQGVQARLLDPKDQMPIGLKAAVPAILVGDDWRLEPRPMLAAMRDSLQACGGRIIAADLVEVQIEEGRATAARLHGQVVPTDQIVLATGLPPHGLRLSLPEFAALTPIKGQLIRYNRAGPPEGPIVRSASGYVVPGAAGACVGATMEPGLSDRGTTARATERLRALAEDLFPQLRGHTPVAEAGVRASTPDGLPLVGRSSLPGVLLALGARRNGWLLAPTVADVLGGLIQGAEDTRFLPERFLRPA